MVCRCICRCGGEVACAVMALMLVLSVLGAQAHADKPYVRPKYAPPEGGVAGACGEPGSGDCLTAHANPGCDDFNCCSAVCAIDPFCCDTEWDGICAGEAVDLCASCGGSAAGSCFVPHENTGCNDQACCDQVCAIDPFCCDTEWDGICASEAAELCAGCGTAAAGSCYTDNGTAGCNDLNCCSTVCAIDPYCCEVAWDGICADEAADMCGVCGTEEAGSCFFANGSVGCDNGDCCAIVCFSDPFCCDTEWDQICADEAASQCAGLCGDPNAGNCFAAHSNVSCNDATCCQAVCAIDPFCCDTEWDGICADEAAELCGNCGDPGAGSCFAANGSVGCNNGDCCATVCAVDPFCCDTEWDGICASEAAKFCSACPQDCVSSATFAPPPDGVVDGADLANLLGSWTPTINCMPAGTCCADTVTSATFAPPPDGIVDGADLAVLLGAWGNPPCQN